MSAEDFIAWDRGQTTKYEFVRGEIFLMAGGEDTNVTVAGNLYVALRTHLRDTPCRTYFSDMKLRVEAADCYYYPDVMVTCSAADAAERLVKREPVLVVEVLSSSTAAYDRGDKFADYRLLPSLREVLLVEPRTRRCDLYRKGDDGLWVLHPSLPGQAVTLASVDLTVSAEQLWDEVPPNDAAQPAPSVP